MLPHVVFAAMMIGGVWFASRWVREEVARVEGQMRRMHRILEHVRNGRIPRLEADPVTGHYFPVKL